MVTADGEMLGRTLVFHDVTQSKAVQRMKSQFMTTASHQLRTPMASIMTFSELSLSKEVAPAKQREWLELIHSQSVRMAATINSILNVSQIESGRLDLEVEEINATEVCGTVVKEFESKVPSHKFHVWIPANARKIWGRMAIVDTKPFKLSLSHKAESSSMLSFWIPAFAGMTAYVAVFHTLSGWS